MAKRRSFRGLLCVGNFAQNKFEMSEYSIHIELPDYLRQWFVHEYGNGNQPIAMPRLSTENKILEMCLIPTPHNAIPDVATETSVAIAIPAFPYKKPKTYHYLPRKAREDVAHCIRERFIIELWRDLHRHGHIGKRKDELIYDWMRLHGIEHTEKNWNAIAKIYQRQHRHNVADKRKKKKVQKK